jgi:hypothetical protein
MNEKRSLWERFEILHSVEVQKRERNSNDEQLLIQKKKKYLNIIKTKYE